MHCPNCGFAMADRPDLAGMTFACPQCNGPFTVPAPMAFPHSQVPQHAMQEPFAISPHRVSAPHTTVHVNVPKQNHNSLGTASVILGVVSLFFCWMPIFGLPLAALGTLLGMIGVLVSVFRGGAGLGMPIAGTAISGLVLVIAGYFWGAVVLGIAKVAEDMDKQGRVTEQQQPATPFDRTQLEPLPLRSKSFEDGQREAAFIVDPVPEPTPTATPTFDKPWQASRKWTLTTGRTVEGRLRTWSKFKVVIVQADGNEIATNIDGVSPADQAWVDSKLQ